MHVLKSLKKQGFPEGRAALALGPPGLALTLGRLHEIVPGDIFHLGAAAGFALGLFSLGAARRGGTLVWIQQAMAALEGGAPYGPGMALFGLEASRLLLVRAGTAKDALWAMEEASRTPGIAAVIGELAGAGEAADLAATRRLNLAMEERGGLGLLLRHQPLSGTSASATRWRVRGAPGRGDGLGGIARTAFAVALEKNRAGPCGDHRLEWNDDERCFHDIGHDIGAALPVAVAAPPLHRPHRAA